MNTTTCDHCPDNRQHNTENMYMVKAQYNRKEWNLLCRECWINDAIVRRFNIRDEITRLETELEALNTNLRAANIP